MQAIRPIGLAPVAPPATHAIDRARRGQAAGHRCAAFKDVLRASIERGARRYVSHKWRRTAGDRRSRNAGHARRVVHCAAHAQSSTYAAVQAFNEIKDLHI